MAGSAAAAAAAAIASGMQSLPADNPLQGLQFGRDGGLPSVVETALQLALVAGISPHRTCQHENCCNHLLGVLCCRAIVRERHLSNEVVLPCKVLEWEFTPCYGS